MAVLTVLRRVREGRRFDQALDEAIVGLSAVDRRLTHEVAAGVLRHRRELDRQLRGLTRPAWRSVHPDVKDLLRIGAYQLTYLDRVPGYAALSATVQVAKEAVGSRPAGMVNAVLRRLSVGDAESALPADGLDLAERYSHPRWLVDRWLGRYGADRTEALLRHNNARPELTIRPTRWDPERLRAALQAAGIVFAAAPFDAGFVVRTSSVRSIPGFSEGAFVVQDPAQAELLRFAALPDTGRVWDACAAPGGKAAVLAAGGHRVVASDRIRNRLTVLRRTLRRGAAAVPVLAADACHPPFAAASLDAVLIDAPCSATGTLRRHPDARWRLTERRILALVRRQRDILDASAGVVGDGGRLVYLTCSLEPEENEEQVDGFLQRHPGFYREGDDLSIFPPDAGTDGGYGARMRRRG